MDEETIDWILTDTAIDNVSKVPYAAVVFMLYYGLELKHNLLKTSEKFMEEFVSEIHDFGMISLYLGGSVAQGFYPSTEDILDARDIDIVAVYKKNIRKKCEYDENADKQALKVFLNEEDHGICKDETKASTNVTDESPPSYLNVEVWDDTYPGYVMLRRCRKHELPVQMSLASRYVSSLKTTQSRTEFWRNMQPYLNEDFGSLLDNDRDLKQVFSSVHTQGPAASATFSNMFLDFSLASDFVYALPYPGWPKIAQEWFDRKPASGWPSMQLKKDIVASGCLIVPKGHKGSKREDYEWKISFSLGEIKLARSLNRIQREIAHVLKAVVSEEQYEFGHASIAANFDSYFMLNILFTESEDISHEEWKENNLAHLLFRLLDTFAFDIKRTNLPHYFIAKHNLLFKLLLAQVKLKTDEFKRGREDENIMMDSNEYYDFALYTVLRLRHDPLGQLLQQRRYLRLPGAMHSAVFEPFVNQAKSLQVTNPSIYVSTLLKLAKAHLFMNNFEAANVYIEDASKFLVRLPAVLFSDTMLLDLKITKAVCSYLIGNYDFTLQLFEEVDKETQCLHSCQFREERGIYLMLFARALSTKAKLTNEAFGPSVDSKARQLLEKALTQNPNDPTIELELVNYYMIFGFLPEADLLLMKIQERLIMYEDEYVEMEESDVNYHGEVYTVPVVEEPIYVVHEPDSEDLQEMDDTLRDKEKPLPEEYPGDNYLDGKSDSSQLKEATHMRNSQKPLEACKSAFRTLKTKEEETYQPTWETEMEFRIEELTLSSEIKSDEDFHMTKEDDMDVSNVHCELDAEIPVEEHEQAENENSNEFMGQEEQLNYKNDLNEIEYDSLDSDNDLEGQTFINRFGIEEEHSEYTAKGEYYNSRPMLNFHENQDLINQYALFRAFTVLGLDDDAARVHQRISNKVQKRQKIDKTITLEALEHDLTLYMSYVEDFPVGDNWQNPFAIFKNDVFLSTADMNILDEVLNALVQKCGVIVLHVNDMYYHYRTQLAKYDGKTSEALEFIKYMKNSNLRGIHYEFLGDKEQAETSAWYASLKCEHQPVHEKVTKWVRQLIDDVSKLEPRNVYLESVFK